MEQTEKDKRRERFNRSKKYKKKQKDKVFWRKYKQEKLNEDGISNS